MGKEEDGRKRKKKGFDVTCSEGCDVTCLEGCDVTCLEGCDVTCHKRKTQRHSLVQVQSPPHRFLPA